MNDLTSILLLLLLCASGIFVAGALRTRELAVEAAKAHCNKHGLQFLDQSVALESLSLRRNAAGSAGIMRRYRFDFTSTGDERYHGKITMQGLLVSDLTLQAHRLPEAQLYTAEDSGSASAQTSGQAQATAQRADEPSSRS